MISALRPIVPLGSLATSPAALGILAAIVGAGGLILCVVAVLPKGEPSWRQLLLQLGNALITGGAVAIAIFLLQHNVTAAADRETRLSDLEVRLLMTSDLAGYDPGPKDPNRDIVNGRCGESIKVREQHTLLEPFLAGKILDDANFNGLNLKRANFQDAHLRGTFFHCALLEHADFIGATLTVAEMQHAELGGAKLQAAHIEDVALPERQELTADVAAHGRLQVNVNTCWSENDWQWLAPIARQVLDPRGVSEPGVAHEVVAYGQRCGDSTHVYWPS